MATFMPITLAGENLGKRHLCLNSLVNEAFERNEDFDTIKKVQEKSHIDRIFKIEYASKCRNVDYLIENLKDDDMLYVSRALKWTWLLETKYEEIINPQYLEDSLFPEMITTAITKMQHWIYLHLKDESRCQQFYEYYYKKNSYDLAIKFLTKCSEEKCTQVVNIFFDRLQDDEKLKTKYLSKEKDYFLAIRFLLKTDASMILDINEKYFNTNTLYRFSATQTKHIMRHHIERFWKKPELYATWLLNTQAVANCLSSEDAKNLIVRLEQAKYLKRINWYGYKFLEPIVKRVKPEERGDFKKKVFVKKDVGDEIEEWPYKTPAPPFIKTSEYSSIFDDSEPTPYNSYFGRFGNNIGTMFTSGNTCQLFGVQQTVLNNNFILPIYINKVKTVLDRLFDEFRFTSFKETLYELNKRILAESCPQNREFMILVLVSKSGGLSENITLLLELLARHNNEPPNIRSAIIRSLVKRAYVWRLPETSWKKLLDFGQGLGLDGNTTIANCHEGLHAVVIRNLLRLDECEPSIKTAFLNQFSCLAEYSLNAIEKKQIGERLARMLMSIAEEKHQNTYEAVTYISKVINVLNAYKIKVQTYPGILDIIVKYAQKDISQISFLLSNLFKTKIARKQLFRFYFDVVKSDASYINALRHDITVLDGNIFAKDYMNRYISKADNFLSKISIYFGEENGLASIFLNNIKALVDSEVKIMIKFQPLLQSNVESNLFIRPLHQFHAQAFMQAKIKSNLIHQPLGFQFSGQPVTETRANSNLVKTPSGHQFGGQPFFETEVGSKPQFQPITYKFGCQPVTEANLDSKPIQPLGYQFKKPFIEVKTNASSSNQPSGFPFGDPSNQIVKTDCKPHSQSLFSTLRSLPNIDALDQPSAYQFGEVDIIQANLDIKLPDQAVPNQISDNPSTGVKQNSNLLDQPLGYQFSGQSFIEEKVDSTLQCQPLADHSIVQPIVQTTSDDKPMNQSIGYKFRDQPLFVSKPFGGPLDQPILNQFSSQPFVQNQRSVSLKQQFGCKFKPFNDTRTGIKLLGRPLAYLLGDQLIPYLQKLDTFTDQGSKLLAAAIRANAHFTRPAFDIEGFGWKKSGAKLIANKVFKCRFIEIDKNMKQLLKWKRTAKLAFTLSKRTNYEIAIFEKLAAQRPTAALKSGLKMMQVDVNVVDPIVWDTIKPIIEKLDISKRHLVKKVANTNTIPTNIKHEYITIIYTLFKDNLHYETLDALNQIEVLLPDINVKFIENLLNKFLKEDLDLEKQNNEWSQVLSQEWNVHRLLIRILIKFVFLCKSEDIQKHRWTIFCVPFLSKMEEIRNSPENKHLFPRYLHEVVITLKYSKAFLNTMYMSSVPVMEKLVVWLHKMFSIDENFKVFVFLDLAMLYCKAVRHSVELFPEIFADEKTKHNEGVIIVGKVFGKYVANEVASLTTEYFESIIELYYQSFVIYLDKTNRSYIIPNNWLSSIIIGIIEGSKGSEYRLGIYLFNDKQYNLKTENVQEIQKCINARRGKESQWFLCDF